MKKTVLVVLVAFALGSLMSCSTGKGCPTSGKAIGAERILSGDKKALKAAKKAPKFKA